MMPELATRYPDAGARVKNGAFLAIMGDAESDTATGWWVTSERDETPYFVIPQYGTCTCQDHARHGHLSPCKHQLCAETIHRLDRVEADHEQAATVDAHITLELGEAAYTALAQLGEVPDREPQRPVGTCTRMPMSESARALYRALYGDDPDAA